MDDDSNMPSSEESRDEGLGADPEPRIPPQYPPNPSQYLPNPPQYGYQPVYYYDGGAQSRPPSPASGMYTAAAVLNWVTLGLVTLLTCGIGLVAAAWFVPMTIFIHKGSKDPYKHTALGVCTLLFCNFIAGILMLVEDGKRISRPPA